MEIHDALAALDAITHGHRGPALAATADVSSLSVHRTHRAQPAAPREPTIPRAVAAGSPLPDLLPEMGEEPTARQLASLRGEFTRGMCGRFGEFEVAITGVDVEMASYVVVDTAVSLAGRPAGVMQHNFSRDGEGRVRVSVVLVDLEPYAQGHGFITRYDRHLEDWCRHSGAHRIEVNAGLTAGPYVWARLGYDFAHPYAAIRVIDAVRRELDEVEARLAQRGHDAVSDAGEADRERAAAAEMRDIVHRSAEFDFDDARRPRPLEVSRIGRLPAGGDTTWPGKRILMGLGDRSMGWDAVKFL